MDKDQPKLNRFLEEQVEWCKRQDSILEQFENKFYEMKELAVYARDHELTSNEVNRLNEQLNTLKHEVHSLEQQM